MSDDEFWGIIDATATPQALHERLGILTDAELLAFERRHRQATIDAYRWDLWGAAYVINGGCSDDGFEYFRAYLISFGRMVYEAALTDPDSLADVEIRGEDEEWEDWMSPTMAVIRARTGEPGFAGPDPIRTPGEPAGEEWDEDDLPRLLPRLAAKHAW